MKSLQKCFVVTILSFMSFSAFAADFGRPDPSSPQRRELLNSILSESPDAQLSGAFLMQNLIFECRKLNMPGRPNDKFIHLDEVEKTNKIISRLEAKSLKTMSKSKVAALRKVADDNTPDVPDYLLDIKKRRNLEPNVSCRSFLYTLDSYEYALLRNEPIEDEDFPELYKNKKQQKSKKEPKMRDGFISI